MSIEGFQVRNINLGVFNRQMVFKSMIRLDMNVDRIGKTS